MWPGNGPFRNLPPWERPGWIYGPGSCWTLGAFGTPAAPNVPWAIQTTDIALLKSQKEALENQLNLLKQSLERIEERIREIESK